MLHRTIFTMLLLTGVSSAAFEKWTSKAGKEAELELVKVTGTGGEEVGEFKTRAGKTVQVKASDLSEADAKRLAEFVAPDAAKEAKPARNSIFDTALAGNLVTLQDDKLAPFDFKAKPTDYYLFYYTGYYCAPCQEFTPILKEFYKKNKSMGSRFEIVAISGDRDDALLEKHAKEKQLPWPMLKIDQVQKFKDEFQHQGIGIPKCVLTDLDGKILMTTYGMTGYCVDSCKKVAAELETLLGKASSAP